MGHGSFMQTSFLGGLWSELAQGRMESDRYKTALNVCQNYYPVEQGPLMRRQGTRLLGETRRGQRAKLIPFDFSVVQPYQIEFTDEVARFWFGTSRLYDDPANNITDISTATPAVVTTSVEHGWDDGNDVVFDLPGPPCRAPALCNRQFTINKLTDFTFSIADALTGAPVDGSTLGWSFNSNDQVFRIMEIDTPYTEDQLTDLHFVQDETTVVFMRNDMLPQVLTQSAPFFQIDPAVFVDGPYLDVNETTTTLDPSGTTGSISVTASSIVGINEGEGFKTTDIGRLIRIRSAAAAWSGATTYAVGDIAEGSDGQMYSSLTAGNTNHNPINDVVNWAVSLGGVVWTWLQITAWSSTTVVTATVMGVDLLNGNATAIWRLGLFSDTTGYPTCGGYHENRFWFGGVLGNRFDASMSEKHFDFTPTASDGTVADNHAIAGTFTANDVNQILWFLPLDDGLYAGTPAGEWRIRAAVTDDPITPTSIQARRITTFQTADQQALSTPKTVIFTQRMKRKLMEFIIAGDGLGADGNNMVETADDVTVGGVEEIVYQQEPCPMLWARRADNMLIGCSYKRTKDIAYAGWHEVFLGNDRLVESLSTGPDARELGEALYMISADPLDDDAPRYVEMLTPMFDANTSDQDAWFVDSGIVPCCAEITSGNLTAGTITFYGLQAHAGEEICPFIAGVDVGERTVSLDGTLEFVLGSDPDGVVTGDYLTTRNALDLAYHGTSVDILVGTDAAPDPDITVPSIMAYDGPAAGVPGNVTAASGFSAAVDWDNKFIYFHDDGGSAGDGIRKFELDPGGELVTDKESDNIVLPHDGLDTASGGYWELTNNYDKLIMITDASNSAELSSVRTNTLTYDASFGAISSGATPSTSTRILAPNNLCTINAQHNDYIVSISASLAAGPEVCVLPVGTTSIGPNTLVDNLDEASGSGIPCQGLRGSSGGTAYVIGTRNWGGGAGPAVTPFGLYRVTVPLGMTRVGQVAPTDVDATWTNFSLVSGLAYDQLDGNLLTCVETTDVVTHTKYIIKINAANAAVMWVVPVNQIVSILDNTMRHSQIKTGWFFYIGSGGVAYKINTITGAFTTQTFAAYGSIVSQISDDVSNSVIGFGSGGSGGGVPAIGHYMNLPGNDPVSNMWVRCYMGIVAGQDRTPLAADTVYTLGAPMGFCYTSCAQLLRPDFGNDAGAQNGPAFGKKRRLHNYSMLLSRTRGLSAGSDFDHLKPVRITSKGKIVVTPPTLFSGIVSDTIQDDYTFEGQIAWQQDTAYPGIICAVGGYIAAQDK